MGKFDVIVKNLSKREWAAKQDQLTFNNYLDKKLTLEQVREAFFKNNRIKKEEVKELITPELLAEWIRSLGYYEEQK